MFSISTSRHETCDRILSNMADETISLRPIVLKPGVGLVTGNPFASFAKGSGQGLKAKQVIISITLYWDLSDTDGQDIFVGD